MTILSMDSDTISNGLKATGVIGEEIILKSISAAKGIYISKCKKSDEIVEDTLRKLLSEKTLILNTQALKLFDSYTFIHSVNVCVMSMLIGLAMNMTDEALYELGLASILHDIGKIFIPKHILNKQGYLTDDEYEIMKSHPQKGYDYLSQNFQISLSAALGVLDHHKRFDGSGYPVKGQGNCISLFGRIVAISDVFDALTSVRSYREALSPSEAVEYLLGNSYSQFDPDIVEIFIQKIAPYPIGALIKLSNGAKGIIIENNPIACLRPKVKIMSLFNENVTPYTIDLLNDHGTYNITITGMADI